MIHDTVSYRAYIFKGSKAYSMCKDCCVSNPPLGVSWLVVITDSNLCHHWDLQTLKHMPRPWHAISWRERGREGEREEGREGESRAS